MIQYKVVMIIPSIYAWEIPIYPPVYSECPLGTLSPTADNDCCEVSSLAISSEREKDRRIN